jgi:prevent-host-death family protein
MERIGLRELRRNAGMWLCRVRQGEKCEFTVAGKPVALLIPLREHRDLERLIASRCVTVPTEGGVLALDDPLDPPPGLRLPAAVLDEARASER